MAEGGDLSSMQRGSDAEFEYTCTPCGADGIALDAVKYCPECQEHLCTKCTTYHGRLKASRAHKVVDAMDIAKHAIAVKTDKTGVTCQYHPERDVEMYCGTHDMVYCFMCIATEHRMCNRVLKIEDISESDLCDENAFQRLQAEVKSIHEQLRVTNGNKMKNTKAINEQRMYILSRIQEEKGKMTEHLETLDVNTKVALNVTYDKVKDEIDTDITTISDMITDVEKMTLQLEMPVEMGTKQRFVQMKLGQKIVIDAKKLCNDSEFNGNRDICFTETASLSTAVLEATSIGRIETKCHKMKRDNAEMIKMRSTKNVNINMQFDNENCDVIDVCQLPDGTLILADCNNTKLKRLDTNFNVMDCCDLGTYPWGICCIDQNKVAVIGDSNTIQFVSVGKDSMFKTTEILTVYDCGQRCLEYYDKKFWVSAGSGVEVYDTYGILLKTIHTDNNGRAIFDFPTQRMAVGNDSILVTDYSNGAVCLKKDGTVRNKLRTPMLTHSSGVCVSNAGIVYISGFSSNNIVMFKECGECLGELVSADVGIREPQSLYYDEVNDCIIVTCTDSKYIHVVELCN